MRRFFRFSIRDLLWLTLVAAMGLGWFVRERQWRDERERLSDYATKMRDESTKWRMAAGGLEDAVGRLGLKVEWNMSTSRVHLLLSMMSNPTQRMGFGFCEPSASVE